MERIAQDVALDETLHRVDSSAPFGPPAASRVQSTGTSNFRTLESRFIVKNPSLESGKNRFLVTF
jgi:hypothetical protein